MLSQNACKHGLSKQQKELRDLLFNCYQRDFLLDEQVLKR
jgi:hypothetical protein